MGAQEQISDRYAFHLLERDHTAGAVSPAAPARRRRRAGRLALRRILRRQHPQPRRAPCRVVIDDISIELQARDVEANRLRSSISRRGLIYSRVRRSPGAEGSLPWPLIFLTTGRMDRGTRTIQRSRSLAAPAAQSLRTVPHTLGSRPAHPLGAR